MDEIPGRTPLKRGKKMTKKVIDESGNSADEKAPRGRFAPSVPASLGKNPMYGMQTEPGTHRPDSELRDSYAKSMDPKAIEKDITGGGYQTPSTFSMKRNAKKSGKFKGFKI